MTSAPLLGSLASTTMFIAFTSADVTRMGGIWLRYEEREHASFCEAIESHLRMRVGFTLCALRERSAIRRVAFTYPGKLTERRHSKACANFLRTWRARSNAFNPIIQTISPPRTAPVSPAPCRSRYRARTASGRGRGRLGGTLIVLDYVPNVKRARRGMHASAAPTATSPMADRTRGDQR